MSTFLSINLPQQTGNRHYCINDKKDHSYTLLLYQRAFSDCELFAMMDQDFDDFEEDLEQLEELEVLDGEHPIDEEDENGEQDGQEGDTEEMTEDIADASFFTFSDHTDAVYCAAFHPTLDGLVATGGMDDRAFLWKYNGVENCTLQTKIELMGHSDTVTAIGFNFNGSLLLTGSYDGCVRIWNVESGNLIQTLDGPEDIEWAQWHSKGNAVIAGSKDGTVWMWLAHNGQCMQVFAGHDGLVSCGSFSHCGKFVCTAGEDGTVRVWLPKTGACRHVFEGHMAHQAPITCLAVADDLILTGSQDGTAKLFQVSGLRVLNTFVHASSSMMDDEDMELESILGVESVGFSSEQFKWIATGGMDKTLKVWDLSSGTCRVTCSHEGGVVSIKWHPQLPYVCSGSIDGAIRVWDARNGHCAHLLTGHANMVTSVEIKLQNVGSTPCGCIIISASDDNTSKLFHIPRLLM